MLQPRKALLRSPRLDDAALGEIIERNLADAEQARCKSADGMSVSMPTSLRHDARRSSIEAPWRTKGPPLISGRPLDCFIEVAA